MLISVSALATDHQFHVFWDSGIQFSFQHDFHVSLLSYARRGLLPKSHRGLCLHVFVRRLSNDCILSGNMTDAYNVLLCNMMQCNAIYCNVMQFSVIF